MGTDGGMRDVVGLGWYPRCQYCELSLAYCVALDGVVENDDSDVESSS